MLVQSKGNRKETAHTIKDMLAEWRMTQMIEGRKVTSAKQATKLISDLTYKRALKESRKKPTLSDMLAKGVSCDGS
jgi:hypothetical protein